MGSSNGNRLLSSVRRRAETGDHPEADDRPFLLKLNNLTVEAAKIA
jgi:hypothetical protein